MILGASPLVVLVPHWYIHVHTIVSTRLQHFTTYSDETGETNSQENNCGRPWRSPGSSVQRCQGQALAHAETVAEVLLQESCHLKPYCSRHSN